MPNVLAITNAKLSVTASSSAKHLIIQSSSAVIDGSVVGDTWIEVSENLIRSVQPGIHPAPDQIVDGVLIPVVII